MSREIVILGAGESGCGSAVLARRRGYRVFVSDSGAIEERYKELLEREEIEWEEGGHTKERVLGGCEIVKSPGIPDSVPLVAAALARGISVISEIEFAGRYTDAKMLCVTGSNGKTTTTTLIGELLREGGVNVGLGGNIGQSFAMQVASGEPRDWYLLELSSFQLDGMDKFRANIGVLLNITPDHLDRYDGSIDRYAESKMQITRNQRAEDFLIYSADDQNIIKQLTHRDLVARQLPFSLGGRRGEDAWGAWVEDGVINVVVGELTFSMDIADIRLFGKHNLYNVMAAVMSAMLVGVDDDSIRRVLRRFEGVEHRLERVGVVDGVEYINDSKATNVDAVWYALDSMTKPVVWIAGGVDKGNDYSMLGELVSKRVKRLVCMGVDNQKLIDGFEGLVEIDNTHSLEQAMRAASDGAESGDVVLLSPACASFDLFENYEDRGRQFKEWVEGEKCKSEKKCQPQ